MKKFFAFAIMFAAVALVACGGQQPRTPQRTRRSTPQQPQRTQCTHMPVPPQQPPQQPSADHHMLPMLQQRT